MRPRRVMYSDGEKTEAVIHIFTTLPELRYELKTNRFPALTPAQVEVRDPSDKPLEKRKHMTDLLRYIEMADPKYIDPAPAHVSVKPLVDGISY